MFKSKTFFTEVPFSMWTFIWKIKKFGDMGTLIFVSIKKIYQTLKMVFLWLSKHHKLQYKLHTVPRVSIKWVLSSVPYLVLNIYRNIKKPISWCPCSVSYQYLVSRAYAVCVWLTYKLKQKSHLSFDPVR